MGELTNMVAGHATTQVAQFSPTSSSPGVIVGTNNAVPFSGRLTPTTIPFKCERGTIGLDVVFCPPA
ncbi:MAG: hypothetical protein DWQ31_07205 [Planctomycetota bacterium]|nr:MAG: hypothetical protein DWQ31_07205 [Planctomycetota bacterium]REJ93777.1 MAG: hypothetical protein DWQ35_09660 [Planctomycetota bacterium]REK29943.1 MAG: hypothetical protein DWQ42_03315 [Planctomycetota bacterium]REK47887.1 MAG: hypothetical protein DWQ46_03045 [Planctomycetota bacterium]